MCGGAVRVTDNDRSRRLARFRIRWRLPPLPFALQEFDPERGPKHVVESRIQHGSPASVIVSAGIGVRALQCFGASDEKVLVRPRGVIRKAHRMPGYRSPRVDITITELV